MKVAKEVLEMLANNDLFKAQKLINKICRLGPMPLININILMPPPSTYLKQATTEKKMKSLPSVKLENLPRNTVVANCPPNITSQIKSILGIIPQK